MKRSTTQLWLNLLLVIAMVIGPWPVLSGGAGEMGGCCMMSMEMAEDMRHAGCASQPNQEECCMDQGCSGSNCSPTAYLSPNPFAEAAAQTDTFSFVFGDSQPTGANTPPIPPPIV